MIKRVDSGGQVHLVTNIRKPRKWRRYEYLESSGTQWIDTGIKLSLTDKFEFETDFTYSPANGRACPFYGTENYQTGFMAQYHYTNNNLYVVYIKGAQFGNSSVSVTASSRMYSKTVIDVPNKTWATIYNTTSANGTYSNQITDTTSTVKFFGNDQYNKYVAKCYYFKIKINDVLVRDFVPAQYNGQYGMWDLVEDRFYPNKGTGTFTVGPEMKNYDEIDEVRKTTSLLPSGVELYDYIQSSGTQWIDTGYAYTSEVTETYCKYNIASNQAKDLFGCSYNNNRWITLYSNMAYVANANAVNLGHTLNQINEVTFKTGENGTPLNITCNGVVKDSRNKTASVIFGANMAIFTMLDAVQTTLHQSRIYSGKIYHFSMKQDGTLVRNMLPCTYLGEPGMWDTVENKFYRNQGTGQFTLGNKITLKEYEYLQTNATNQSIDTGIQLTDNHSIAYDIIFKYENNGVRRLMGPSGAAGSYFGAGSNGRYDRYSSISIGNIDHLYEEFNLITKKQVAYINNFKYRENNITAANSIGHCYIFSLNGINNYTGAGQYFYSGKMVYDGKVIRDFIPISYNGTPGLWDKVEWKFYANAGSGSFTLGPEKKSGSIYLYDNLTNLFNGFIGGGQMTLSNGILVGTGNNSDTYFYTKTTQAVNTTSYYLVGVYVEGYTSATAWTFCSPQSNSNATLKITRDGWNWGYVKFGNADSQPIWDDANRAFSGPVPKITISDCRIYKIT